MQSKAVPAIVNDEYHDNWIDRIFIWLFSRKISQALGATTQISGYSGFVDLSKQVMQGRNAQGQQLIIDRVLQSLVPAPVLWTVRTFFSPTRLVCVLNAWFAAQLFEWLVGEAEVVDAEVDLPVSADAPEAHRRTRLQPSGVYIKKCRYLAESRCVGMCVNMCQVPTQKFFTEKFGIPLTMTPNFEDLSCTMVFGQLAPISAVDPAHQQPCLAQQCPTATVAAVICPKLH
jgi:Beta-carotene isomerase D27-like, C-terminal